MPFEQRHMRPVPGLVVAAGELPGLHPGDLLDLEGSRGADLGGHGLSLEVVEGLDARHLVLHHEDLPRVDVLDGEVHRLLPLVGDGDRRHDRVVLAALEAGEDAVPRGVPELHLEAADERQWIEEVINLMERNDDEGVFRSFILRILRSYRQDPLIPRVILFAALEGHEQGLARMHKQFAPILERFMEYIARRQREGALADCDPQAIMIGLGGVAHQYGLITQIFLGAPSPGVSDEQMAGIFTRILLYGAHAAAAVENRCGENSKPAQPSNRKANK